MSLYARLVGYNDNGTQVDPATWITPEVLTLILSEVARNILSTSADVVAKFTSLGITLSDADVVELNVLIGEINSFPAPETAVLDTFNRANGAPGANWGTPLGSGLAIPNITGNQIVGSAATSKDMYWVPAAAPVADSEAYATISTAGTYAAVGVRAGTNFAGYHVIADTAATRVSLWEADGSGFSGFETQLGTYVTTTVFDGIWLKAVGNLIIAYTRSGGLWTQQIRVSDNTWQQPGSLQIDLSDVATLDDFGGGTATLTAETNRLNRVEEIRDVLMLSRLRTVGYTAPATIKQRLGV